MSLQSFIESHTSNPAQFRSPSPPQTRISSLATNAQSPGLFPRLISRVCLSVCGNCLIRLRTGFIVLAATAVQDSEREYGAGAEFQGMGMLLSLGWKEEKERGVREKIIVMTVLKKVLKTRNVFDLEIETA